MRFCFPLGVVLVIACTSMPEIKPTGLTADRFWQEQTQRTAYLSSISARARLRYVGKKESLSGRARIVGDLPDRVRLELRDILGRMQMLATVDGNTYTVYYPFRRLAISDPYAGRSYHWRVFETRLSFSELAFLSLGLIPPGWGSSFDIWEWDGGTGVYRASLTKDDTTVFCVIDRDLAVLRELRVGGATRFTYSDFFRSVESSQPNLGHSVAFQNQTAGTEISIQWEEVKKEVSDRSLFRIQIPEGVEKIVLKDSGLR